MAQGFEDFDNEGFAIISQLIGRSFENAYAPSEETQTLEELRGRAGQVSMH